jgi:hypothetical protein
MSRPSHWSDAGATYRARRKSNDRGFKLLVSDDLATLKLHAETAEKPMLTNFNDV